MKDIGTILAQAEKMYVLCPQNEIPIDYSKLTKKARETDYQNITRDYLIKNNFQLIDLYHLKAKTNLGYGFLMAYGIHGVTFGSLLWMFKSTLFNHFKKLYLKNSKRTLRSGIFNSTILSLSICASYSLSLGLVLSGFDPYQKFQSGNVINSVSRL